ncbi:MAG: hypothetical protein R3B72_52420 [Polyangiaceae bacterium]
MAERPLIPPHVHAPTPARARVASLVLAALLLSFGGCGLCLGGAVLRRQLQAWDADIQEDMQNAARERYQVVYAEVNETIEAWEKAQTSCLEAELAAARHAFSASPDEYLRNSPPAAPVEALERAVPVALGDGQVERSDSRSELPDFFVLREPGTLCSYETETLGRLRERRAEMHPSDAVELELYLRALDEMRRALGSPPPFPAFGPFVVFSSRCDDEIVNTYVLQGTDVAAWSTRRYYCGMQLRFLAADGRHLGSVHGVGDAEPSSAPAVIDSDSLDGLNAATRRRGMDLTRADVAETLAAWKSGR